MDMNVEEIKQMLTKPLSNTSFLKPSDYLSTGSTLLNLACSGKTKGGFIKGGYFYIVGDSASGKTFLSLTCLAEAAKNKDFDDYRFIYDNSENGALMSIEDYFGQRVSQRIEPPSTDDNGEPKFSSTIEEFYFNVDEALQKGKPFIYILDSMDCLSSEDEITKFYENKEAFQKGKQLSGSYGDGKAKKNSANLRRLIAPLRASGSILIIISQTRDNLTGIGFERKIRSGGHALRFYATLEIWSSVAEKIKKTVKGKPRQIGIICQLKIKKNRLTGKERVVNVPIYHSFGFDDIGSCVDYLIEENHWQQKGAVIDATEFDIKTSREKLIKHIEENNLEKDLICVVEDVWNEIEAASTLERKKRYE